MRMGSQGGPTMKRAIVATAVVILTLAGTGAAQRRVEPVGGEVKALLLPPPQVPAAIRRSGPAKVVVELETTEQTGTLASGVEYTFWTFGGTVPGPMLRVRTGDTVQIKLTNQKTAHNTHSIDLHAVTGPGGGAAVTQAAPGESGVFEL